MGRVLELHDLRVREQLAPLVEEDRLEDAVAHAPDERHRHVELLKALVDRAHQRRAAVALGERDVALEGERPDARPVVRERRAVGVHHHRVGVALGHPPGDRLDEQVAAKREDLAEPLGAKLAHEGRQEARQLPGPGVHEHEPAQPVRPLEHRAEADRAAPVVGHEHHVASGRARRSARARCRCASGACSGPAAAACPSARSPCGRTRRSGGPAPSSSAIGRRQR